MRMIVDGREYEVMSMANPKMYPLAFTNKLNDWYLLGKRGAWYTLTQWKNGAYSLMDSGCRYRDNVTVKLSQEAR